jgi:DNA polymerase III subunit delta'
MSWEDLPAQPRAVRFLRQLVQRQRVPHALLLTGMAGVEKAALAVEFAKLVNCHNPHDGNCCAVCSACHKIQGGFHPDVVTVAPDGQFIKIEQVRAVKGQLRFRPFEGLKRVIIVQDAHRLREEAGNALLKILEEPPRDHIFVLLALDPQMLLPTLVSRCCQVRLQPLPDIWLTRHLMDQYQMTEEEAAPVARQAMGSLVRARQLVESKHLEHHQWVLARVQELAHASMTDFFQGTSQWVKESQDLGHDLEILQFWLRDGIVSRLLAGGVTGRGASHGDSKSDCLRVVPIDYVFSVYQHVEQALQQLRGNANRQLTLEGVCLIIKDLLYGQGDWYSIPGGWQDLSLQSW